MINKIHNEDCFVTMRKMRDSNTKCNIVLTSPPYNTSRKGRKDKYSTRYDVHVDDMTDEEYVDFSIKLFKDYDSVLKTNGVILYNLSYSSENTHLLWITISEIIKNTGFTVADMIVWKKKNAIPNNVSKNKLTRIVEYVFVFCRKDEIDSFQCNKRVKSVSRFGQNYYEGVFNYIEAKNNDGSCDLNKCTYSSDLCVKLLNIYGSKRDVVYDSFMGTGTTAVGCIMCDMEYIGSEISKNQCGFANNRIYSLTNLNNYDSMK